MARRFNGTKDIDKFIDKQIDELQKKLKQQIKLNIASILMDGINPEGKIKVQYELEKDGNARLKINSSPKGIKMAVLALTEEVAIEDMVGFYIAMQALMEGGLADIDCSSKRFKSSEELEVAEALARMSPEEREKIKRGMNEQKI